MISSKCSSTSTVSTHSPNYNPPSTRCSGQVPPSAHPTSRIVFYMRNNYSNAANISASHSPVDRVKVPHLPPQQTNRDRSVPTASAIITAPNSASLQVVKWLANPLTKPAMRKGWADNNLVALASLQLRIPAPHSSLAHPRLGLPKTTTP